LTRHYHRLGYQKEDIFTIGNSLNDMTMIRDFNGFAVTDSDPQLIPLASAVFPNVSACIEYLMKL
jgi:hydroxymethylpyrimidine pyrophosphatase-like HAD family hydrolase